MRPAARTAGNPPPPGHDDPTRTSAMSLTVTLQPSGRRFQVHHRESVLAAALRAGLSLNYSCSNGSCGECQARLLRGEVTRVRHYDYVFSEREKLAGHVLLCSVTPVTDIDVVATAARGVEDIPVQRIPARVARLQDLDAHTRLVHLKTPRTQTLRFLAGQHVTLNIEGLTPRNKSIASCPCNARDLHFHVRRVPGDPLSEHVFGRMRTGDRVVVEGPWGVFTLDEDSDRPMILLAYETGFAPLQSIIEHVIALARPQPLHLYWLVDRPGGHYLDNQVRAWVDALDNFFYHRLVAGPPSGRPLDRAGRAEALRQAARQIGRDHPDLSPFDLYLCGPDSLTGPAVADLRAHGADPERIFVDSLKRF